jgi:hypothetical protein
VVAYVITEPGHPFEILMMAAVVMFVQSVGFAVALSFRRVRQQTDPT